MASTDKNDHNDSTTSGTDSSEQGAGLRSGFEQSDQAFFDRKNELSSENRALGPEDNTLGVDVSDLGKGLPTFGADPSSGRIKAALAGTAFGIMLGFLGTLGYQAFFPKSPQENAPIVQNIVDEKKSAPDEEKASKKLIELNGKYSRLNSKYVATLFDLTELAVASLECQDKNCFLEAALASTKQECSQCFDENQKMLGDFYDCKNRLDHFTRDYNSCASDLDLLCAAYQELKSSDAALEEDLKQCQTELAAALAKPAKEVAKECPKAECPKATRCPEAKTPECPPVEAQECKCPYLRD